MDKAVVDKAEELFALANIHIKNKAPYYLPTVYGFVLVPVAGLNTMGVTADMVLYFDPDWVVTCTPEEIAGAVVHESDHHLHDHTNRLLDVPDQDTVNDAADMTINPDLRTAGWKLPKGKGIYPEDFDLEEGLLTEEYYEELQKKKEKQQANGGGGSASGGQGNQQGQPGGDGKHEHDGPRGVGHGGCGGIAGNPGAFEKELNEKYGRSTFEKDAFKKQTAQAIKEHVQQHGRGSVPSDLLEFAEKEVNQKKSRIPWQRKFANKIRKASGRIEAGGVDFSLARPSKRSYARGFPRPGLVARQPEIAFIEDTSGSMGKPQHDAVIREAVSIFRSLGIEMAWYIQADTSVKSTKRIRTRDLLGKMEVRGRGGTHFDQAIRHAEKLKPRPDIIVYLTDGDGGATYKPRGIEVIWCVVYGHWNRKPEADFGDVIIVGQEGNEA